MSGLIRRLVLGAAILLVIGRAGATRADSVAYVVAHDYSGSNGPDLFGQLDVTTGNFTLVSDLSTPGYTIFGMGFGANGQIYGVGYSFTNSSAPGEFFSINPTTGAATDLGPLSFSPAGAASGSNGILYTLSYTSSTASLYSNNPPSNSSNSIGSVPFTVDGLVAIDSHGNFFAAGNQDGSFFEVNTTNASTTLIGNTGLGGNLYAGTFVGSTLYGFSANATNDTIVTIDTSDASISTGATIDLPANYDVVAAASAVPEPSSLVLAGTAGLVGLGLCARRRRV